MTGVQTCALPISQAGSVLVTDSEALADAVDAALERRLAATRHRQRAGTALRGPQSGVVLVWDTEQALAVADAYAPEHLEVQTADAARLARRVRNAGAVFVGPYSPVPLGDYLAGSNHVLPTGGTARFTGGLSVMSYLKPVQVVEYDAAALEAVTGPLTALAEAEDPDRCRQELIAEYDQELANPYVAAERGYIDQVIYPHETRAQIIRVLRLLRTKREQLPPKKHGNIPL